MTHSPTRDATTTPLQQLFVLNSPFMAEQAAALVERLKTDVPDGDTATRVTRAYRWLYQREPTAGQVQRAIDYLTETSDQPPSDARWREYAQALLGSNEFLFVD